jgi:hypothetical protein
MIQEAMDGVPNLFHVLTSAHAATLRLAAPVAMLHALAASLSLAVTAAVPAAATLALPGATAAGCGGVEAGGFGQ